MGQENAGGVVGRSRGGTGGHLGGLHPTSSPSAALTGAGHWQEQLSSFGTAQMAPGNKQRTILSLFPKALKLHQLLLPSTLLPLLQRWLFPTAPL